MIRSSKKKHLLRITSTTSITVTRETLGQGFHLDGKIHFSWGPVKVVSTDCYELYEGIELLVDKIEATARKEKGKIQEHQ